MKKYVGVAVLLLASSAVFALADDFSSIDSVVSSLDASAKKTMGTGGTWLVGMLPLILLCVGLFGGFKYAKKQADQDQDSNKVFITAGIGGVVGAIVGIAMVASMGALLMGDSSLGLKVLTDFWKGVFGL